MKDLWRKDCPTKPGRYICYWSASDEVALMEWIGSGWNDASGAWHRGAKPDRWTPAPVVEQVWFINGISTKMPGGALWGDAVRLYAEHDEIRPPAHNVHITRWDGVKRVFRIKWDWTYDEVKP